MKRVVALVDHSIYADSVGDHVDWLIGEVPADIRFVHCVNPYDMEIVRAGTSSFVAAGPNVMSSFVALPRARLDALRAKGEALVSSLTHRFDGRPMTRAEGLASVGEVPATISDMSSDADVVLMGKRGEHADFVSLSLGGLVHQVFAQTSTPLLVVPRMFRDIARWLIAFRSGPDLDQAVASGTIGTLLPPIPCEIVCTRPEEPAAEEAMSRARDALARTDFSATMEFTEGPAVAAIAARAVRNGIGLIATRGFERSSLMPRLFGEGLAGQLVQACQTPALLLR